MCQFSTKIQKTSDKEVDVYLPITAYKYQKATHN